MAQEQSVTRNHGIDLLRIVSMLMVVILHILGCGGILKATAPLSTNYNIAWFLEISAYCAVNCYALISGYVGIKSKHRYSNLITLWLQVAFYSIIISLIFYFVRPDLVSIKDILKAFLPATTNQYWYFTAYFAMWFFIPVLNNAVEHTPKLQLFACLLISAVIILPISLFSDAFQLNGGYGILWLSYLYLLGAFISKYKLLKKISSLISFLVYLLSIVLTFVSKLALVYMRGSAGETLVNYISPTILLAALGLLGLFVNLSIPKKLIKVVAFVSPLAFSVYLIHTQPLVFSHIFRDAFAFLASSNPILLIVSVLGFALSIFSACALIDYIRLSLFKLLKLKQLFSKAEAWVIEKSKK